ncbi:MAG TPA: ester cyclase [Solirubrobacteraceae bacterium]|jgi:steroid delta-isomerase-like uncharacterized protein|nr:ester cyclase [Solirubrobacteraceae bacterium]
MALTRLQQAWNGQSGESVAQAFTPDGVRIEYALPPARFEGREVIAEHAQNSVDALPDCSLEIRKETRGEDGTVTVEWTWKGTHTGEMPGWPARGEQVELHGVSVCEMAGDLIREERVYWDTATLLAGAGLLG